MERRTQPGYEYHSCDFMDDGVYIDMNLLREYEDTGLTPEQIRELKEALSRENTQETARSSRDNDGWIPVDDRLPEMFGKYWATIRYDDGRISEPIVVDFRGVRQKYVVDTPNGREYETWGIDSAFHGSRVIAWRPYYIPEPYRPERSNDEKK